MITLIIACSISFCLGIVVMAILQMSREGTDERSHDHCNCNRNTDVCGTGGVSGRNIEGKEHDPAVVDY